MFGEYVFGMEIAEEYVQNADIFVVVGTSLMVYPANNLILHAHKEIPKLVIDPGEMPKCDALGYTHFKTTASEVMKLFLEAVKEL